MNNWIINSSLQLYYIFEGLNLNSQQDSCLVALSAMLKHPKQISSHPRSPVWPGLIYNIEPICHTWVDFPQVIKMSQPRL